MSRLSFCGVVAAAFIAVMMPASASAVTYDKLAYLTFSAPVQIPGVTLTAGTYRFRLANPDTSRNVLQVLSDDGETVYAMFHTIPDSRTSVTADPIVMLRETPAGAPPAVKSLFYGGEYNGYEFVYPTSGPTKVTELVPQPDITYAPSAPAPAAAPSFAATIPEPVIEPEAFPVAEPPAEPAPQAAALELPRTASPLPLMAIGGLTSLFAGLWFGLLRRRTQ
jgi:hypothetical protein